MIQPPPFAVKAVSAVPPGRAGSRLLLRQRSCPSPSGYLTVPRPPEAHITQPGTKASGQPLAWPPPHLDSASPRAQTPWAGAAGPSHPGDVCRPGAANDERMVLISTPVDGADHAPVRGRG